VSVCVAFFSREALTKSSTHRLQSEKKETERDEETGYVSPSLSFFSLPYVHAPLYTRLIHVHAPLYTRLIRGRKTHLSIMFVAARLTIMYLAIVWPFTHTHTHTHKYLAIVWPFGFASTYVIQRPFGCYSVWRCVAVCCSVLQRVAVCCSVLQCVAVCYSVWPHNGLTVCVVCAYETKGT